VFLHLSPRCGPRLTACVRGASPFGMGHVFEWVRSVPAWVWPTIVGVALQGGLLAMLYREARRGDRWKFAARAAAADARAWRAVAEHAGASVYGKKTVVAPQYHSPKSSSSWV
jgi:hypothetical protein